MMTSIALAGVYTGGLLFFGAYDLGLTVAVLLGIAAFVRPEISQHWQVSMNLANAEALLAVILGGIFVARVNKLMLLHFFEAAAVYTALGIILGFPLPGFFYENLSMSGCFCACMLPIFFSLAFKERSKLREALCALLIVAIFWTGQAQPVALMFVGLLAHLYARYRGNLNWLNFVTIGMALLVGYLAYIHFTKGDFSDNGRFIVWRESLTWWLQQKFSVRVFGAGLGSFSQIGPVLTKDHPYGRYIWMHSDWLQVLFELGYVGFFTCVYLARKILDRQVRCPSMWAASVVYMLWMVANMPMHFAVSGMLGILFLVMANKTLDTTKCECDNCKTKGA